MNKNIKILINFCLLLAIALHFQNCSEPLPEEATQTSTDTSLDTDVTGAIRPKLTAEDLNLSTNETSTISVVDGTPPYTYEITPTSAGTINPTTLKFRALATTTTTVQVVVIDSALVRSHAIYFEVTPLTSCTKPWGGMLAHLGTVTAFRAASAVTCESEVRACNNGTLSGTFTRQNCVPLASCTKPWGGMLAHLGTVRAYKASSAVACESEIRTCNNGTLSGTFAHQSCVPMISCGLPWGGSIAHGQSVFAYYQSSSATNECSGSGQYRTCNNGTLSGSAIYQSCTNSCFTAETLITMADGSQKPISEVKIGDQVRSGLTDKINKVSGIEVPVVGKRALVSLNGGKAFFTPEHPFLTEQGWKSLDPDEAVREHGMKEKVTLLKLGDKVKLNGKWVEVTEIKLEKADAKRKVYNLLLEGDNTYIANGYSVHNKN